MATSIFEQELDMVKADVSALRDDIKNLVAAFGKNARERVASAGDTVKIYSKKGAVAAEHQIVEHPFTSVAVAFGTGLLLGRLLNGR